MKKMLMLALVFSLCLSAFVVSTPQAEAEAANPASAMGLYAGTSDPGVVWEYRGGTTWEAMTEGPLGYAVLSLVEYNGHLYAGTTSAFGSGGTGRVYRYDGGTTWTLVGDNLDGNVCALVVYKGDLYAGTSWNGMRLYRYDGGTTWTLKVDGGWYGTRSLYVYGDYLLMGDVLLDYVGLWDGTTFHPVQPIGMGSCIYDFQEYGGSLYGAAYVGRLWHSPDGWSWTVALDSYRAGNMWALEEFRGELYMSYNNGELRASNVPDRGRLVYTAPDGIISMTTGGDHLYFGTGGDAVGHGAESTGIANVYQYDGSNVVLISGYDQFGAGVQVLHWSDDTTIFTAPYAFGTTWRSSIRIPRNARDAALNGFSGWKDDLADPSGGLLGYSVFTWGGYAGMYNYLASREQNLKRASQEVECEALLGVDFVPSFTGIATITASFTLEGEGVGCAGGAALDGVAMFLPYKIPLIGPGIVFTTHAEAINQAFIRVDDSANYVTIGNLLVSSVPLFAPSNMHLDYTGKNVEVSCTIDVEEGVPITIKAGLTSELRAWGNASMVVNLKDSRLNYISVRKG